MATTVAVGTEPITDEQAIYQQKIKELMAKGFSREDAEKAAPHYICLDYTVTPSYQRQHAENLSRAPNRTTLSDLEEEAYLVRMNLDHYAQVKIEAAADVKRLEEAEKAALEVLKEMTDVNGVEARSDREKALEVLERVRTFRLPQAKSRLENIILQLKTWRKRESEFPHDEYKRLKAEHKRRRRLSF